MPQHSSPSYALLLLPLILIVGGQSCAKLAGTTFGDAPMPGLLFGVGTYLFFGIRGVVWAIIVKRFKLSVAYPVLSLSFPLVLLVSSLIFAERVSLYNILGAFTVVAGVLLISLGEIRLAKEEGRR
ncbi:MAG: hypothetical protein ACLFQW_12255 [Spirochaetaceae bacterium]